MARDRFSDLERIYDALKLGNVTISGLPQTLDFVKYANWREGRAPVSTVTMPALNGEIKAGVIAFGYDSSKDIAKKLVTMTGRSHTFWSGLSANAKFGLVLGTGTPPSDPTGYNKDGNFVPAKAHVGVKGTAAAKTSRITGRSYKKKITAAYTIPVGQTTTNKHFNDSLQEILADSTLKAYAISISPEQIRRD